MLTAGSFTFTYNANGDGSIAANTNTTMKLPFGFAGGLMDWDTGLVHFSARQYDPSWGRWLSKDPIIFGGGEVTNPSKVNNVNQQALIDITKSGGRNGFTPNEVNILKDWANEYKMPFRGPEVHPNRPFGKEPHFHLGPINHVKVRCE